MLFVFSLVIAAIFALTAKSTIKRHPYPWYIGALVLTLFISLFPFSRELPEPVTFVLDLFRRGALACALWCIVMWTGAFANGSKLIKRLMPVRGELSIFAAMLTLGHNIGYGRTYFVRFFTNASALPANQFAACIITLILLIIMIPLTILSFPKIRKRMKAKKWKKIQRFAYLFYALLYIHIMLLFIPLAQNGRDGYYISVIIYTAIFLGYAICRIRKWYFLKKKPSHKREFTAVCAVLFAVILSIVCVAARPKNTEDDNNSNTEMTETIKMVETTESTKSSKTIENTYMMSESAASASENNSTVDSETISEDSSEASESISEVNSEGAGNSSSTLTDGVYEASAYGYDGTVKVIVTIEGGKITDISGTSTESDLWYFDKCKEKVISEILEAQDTDVDAVSGATYSSNGIKNAVQKALQEAGLSE